MDPTDLLTNTFLTAGSGSFSYGDLSGNLPLIRSRVTVKYTRAPGNWLQKGGGAGPVSNHTQSTTKEKIFSATGYAITTNRRKRCVRPNPSTAPLRRGETRHQEEYICSTAHLSEPRVLTVCPRSAGAHAKLQEPKSHVRFRSRHRSPRHTRF